MKTPLALAAAALAAAAFGPAAQAAPPSPTEFVTVTPPTIDCHYEFGCGNSKPAEVEVDETWPERYAAYWLRLVP